MRLFTPPSLRELMEEALWLYFIGYKEDAHRVLYELARNIDRKDHPHNGKKKAKAFKAGATSGASIAYALERWK